MILFAATQCKIWGRMLIENISIQTEVIFDVWMKFSWRWDKGYAIYHKGIFPLLNQVYNWKIPSSVTGDGSFYEAELQMWFSCSTYLRIGFDSRIFSLITQRSHGLNIGALYIRVKKHQFYNNISKFISFRRRKQAKTKLNCDAAATQLFLAEISLWKDHV